MMSTEVQAKIETSPKDPGVYIFYYKNQPLYVGKASNLKNRLRSYLKITDIKTQSLHEEATRLDYLTLRSEIEALIEESRLIKELKPKYNILWRDDKSYLYVAITRHSAMTRNSAPKIFVTHKNLKTRLAKFKVQLIGPFTDGNALRLAMKTIRRYFPYCTCLRPHFRECLNAQIGRCAGFCCLKTTSVIAREAKIATPATAVRARDDGRKEYARNIRKIKMILTGQSKKLLKTLTDPKEHEALGIIFEHREFLGAVGEFSRSGGNTASSEHPAGDLARPVRYQFKTNGKSPRGKKGLPQEQTYSGSEKQFPDGSKIECYDNSNFAGKEAVGAMTALVKKDNVWMPDKNSYRKFKIKTTPTRDDPRMIYEVVSRRLNHPEWAYPDLIIIDGGITQLNAALKAQMDCQNPEAKKIKITSFPKPQRVLLGWPNAPKEILELAERAIYQTHNFVIRYHRQVRNKELFATINK